MIGLDQAGTEAVVRVPIGGVLIRALGALVAALRVTAAQPPRAYAPAGDVPRLLGCYALFDSTGNSALGRIPGAPAVVRLDTVTAAAPAAPARPFQLPADTAPRVRLVAMSTDGVHSARDLAAARVLWPHNRWAVGPRGDSLSVSFTTRSSGLVFIFGLPAGGGRRVVVGDTLVGRALEYRDFGPPHRIDHDRVTAVRVTCPPRPPPSSGALPAVSYANSEGYGTPHTATRSRFAWTEPGSTSRTTGEVHVRVHPVTAGGSGPEWAGRLPCPGAACAGPSQRPPRS